MLRVALSALGLADTQRDVTLAGDRPGLIYADREGELDRAASEIRQEDPNRTDPGFNDWLNKALHETYDAVAQEPLPSDFDALISRLEKLPPDA